MKLVPKSGMFCLLAAAALLAGAEPKSSGSPAPESKSEPREKPLDMLAFIASELATGKQQMVLPPGRYRVKPSGEVIRA